MFGMAAAIVAAIPSALASASGETLIVATTQNPSPLLVSVGRYSLAAVLPQDSGSNPRAPLTVSLTASNGHTQSFLLRNFGEMDVTAFTLTQAVTSLLGAASPLTSYCAGGSANGAFQSPGVCAGGGTLTRAATGAQSANITLSIGAGSSREFEVVTQSPVSGKDNTVTISVAVDASGVRSGTSTNS
jgi:hypothetical protein